MTIATNMAGRGTDIKLGEGVKEVGGLFIIGTERHEARRIDNQLRGRAGRQGDPGYSQFYVSLEDELMRRFGGDKLKNMMNTLGLPEDQPIQNPIISKTIENAQQKIEGYNFDIRKHVLDYDDVMNKQREVVYKKRKEILEIKDTKSEILNYLDEQLERIISFHCIENEESGWDIEHCVEDVNNIFPIKEENRKKLEEIKDNDRKNDSEKMSAILEYLMGVGKQFYGQKEAEIGSDIMRQAEKMIILQTIDNLWMNHLDEIDYLRAGIGLRGYGQRDPLVEYKREAFNLFSHLMENVRSTIIHTIFHIAPISQNQVIQKQQSEDNWQFKGADEQPEQFGALKQASASNPGTQEESKPAPIINKNKVGRNDPCPCGSGKKYKKCCGK